MNKKMLLSLCLACLLSLQNAFAQNQDELLLRRWKMTEIITQKLSDYADKVIDQIIESTDSLTGNKPQEIIDEENMVQNLIDKGSYIDIKKGNVFIMGIYNFIADEILPIKTRWLYLSDDKQTFNVAPQKVEKVLKNKEGAKFTTASRMEYTQYRILELSANTLKLLVEKVGDTKPNTIITFKPAQ